MIKFPPKIILAVSIILMTSQTVFSKDGKSIGIEFGGVGSEKRFTNSSDSYSDTYTMTLFNSELRLRFDLPAADIKDNCFLNINLNYDLSWSNYNTSDINYYFDSTQTDHKFTFQPELVFSKDDLRFFFGSGFTFAIEFLATETKSSSQTQTLDCSNYVFIWNFELGTKYCLNEHLSVLADFTISMPFITLQRDCTLSQKQSGRTTIEDYADANTHGRSAMYFSPKVGITYTF